MTVINMFLNTEGASKIITENFEFSKLKLNKFEQSGMKRAIIQYESTKSIDLLLLTHIDDILIIENELMKKCLTSPAHHNF